MEGSSLCFEGVATKCFGFFAQRARELNATGLSPCCLPGLSGGGARVKENFRQGHKSSAIFRNGA